MPDLWVTVLIAFIAASPGILAFFASRRSAVLNHEAKFNERVMQYSKNLEDRVTRLEATLLEKGVEIDELHRENIRLQRENDELRKLVEQLQAKIAEVTLQMQKRRRTPTKQP